MDILKGSKKIWLFLIAAVVSATLAVLVLIIVQVSGLSDANENKTHIERINMLTAWGGYSEKNIAMSDIINAYSDIEPNVSITNTSLSDEEFYARLSADFSSGCAADVIIAPPSYDIMSLCRRGYIADLQSEFAKDTKWSDSFDREMFRFVEGDSGQIFGIPTDVEYVLLYCNKNLFEKYGLSIPKKYSDFLSAVNTFTASGVTPVAFGANDSNLYLYQIITSMFEGEISSGSTSAGLPPQYMSAMKEMCNLYNAGAFPRKYSHMSADDAKKMFLDDKAAMIVETNGFINDINHSTSYAEYTEKYEIMAFPYANRDKSTVVFSTVAYNAGDYTIFVNKQAYKNNRNMIMKFVKYLTNSNTLRLYLAQTNDIMTVKDIENKEYKMPLVAKCKIAVGNATKVTRMPIDITYRYVWSKTIQKRLPDILSGNITAARALEETMTANRQIGVCEVSGQ